MTLDEPVTYEQLEATGALYKALYKLGQEYKLAKPYELVNKMKPEVEAALHNLIARGGSAVITVDIDEDEGPINLDNIPF